MKRVNKYAFPLRSDEYWVRKCILLLFVGFQFLVLSSCGYSIIGSRNLPFDSINISNVVNNTYEPRLEERLHKALSEAFLAHGVKVMSTGGDIDLDATVTTFVLKTIAAVDERVKEQEMVIEVDVKLTEDGRVTEFRSLQSPIRITFETTGSITEYVVQKERAIDKSFEEISKEIVSSTIIRYVE